MEEPENGIHPSNLAAMMQLVQDLAVDASTVPDAANPFRQVIVNTHSPGVVQLCGARDLVYARMPNAEDGLQLYGFENSWRARAGADTFSLLDAIPYLTPPRDVQLELPINFSAA